MTRACWTLTLLMIALLTPGQAAAQATRPADQMDFLRPAEAGPAAREDDSGVADAARAGAEILPVVRLTPRDVDVPGLPDARLDLNGAWDFIYDVPKGFDGTGTSVPAWEAVQVPLHFALQDFPKMHEAFGVPVAYRKRVDVPASFAGRYVALRFEGVDGLTKLWVNGVFVGSSDIATLPSEFDVTPFLRPGEENEIVVTVEVSRVTHWSRRELGGITRDVYLQALPTTHLARLHVDAAVNGDDAMLNTRLRVAHHGEAAADGLSVVARLYPLDGDAVLAEQALPLRPIAAGEMMDVLVPIDVRDVRPWTAESPDLYRVSATLLAADETPLMSADQRFGFREIEVVGHELRLNGSPIKLRGTNYHITAPGLGESVPPELIRRDLELFLDANFNALRSRPTPDIAYVDLCDEMGVYTTVEAMVTLMIYVRGVTGDHGANPEIAPGYRRHVATMIESYYSNPSVVAWGLGNECPYYDWIKSAAPGMKQRDPTRPLFFGSDRREGVGIPFMDLHDDHYPRGRDGVTAPHFGTGDIDDPAVLRGEGWDYPDDRPNLFTEWMIIPGQPSPETSYDPGILDFWAFVADTHMEALYARPHFAGGFHFKGAPYTGVKEESPGGIFDIGRRPMDIAWHVKKTHSPVRILDTTGERDGTRATWDVTNRYDFRDLADVTFRWTSGGDAGEASVAAGPREVGTLALPISGEQERTFELEVIDLSGRVIDRYALDVPASDAERIARTRAERQRGREARQNPEPREPPSVVEHDDGWEVTANGRTFKIGKASGLITSASVGGTRVIDGSPTVLVLPAHRRGFRYQKELALINQTSDWTAEHVMLVEADDAVIVTAHGRYPGAAGTFTTTIAHDGKVSLAHAFVWTAPTQFNVLMAGLAIPVGGEFDTLGWDRRARWSVYPEQHIGRPTGTAAAVPETDGPLPWSLAMADGASRDFRSTRFHINHASLTDDAGRGIRLDGEGQALHAQAVPNDAGGFTLHAPPFHSGGSAPHLTKSLRFEEKYATPGEVFSGLTRFELIAGE